MATLSKRRWFRFSLATLLVVVTGLSLWLGRQTRLARQQDAAVRAIVAGEGVVLYNDDSQSSSPKAVGAPSIFVSLRHAVGDDYFRTVKSVDLATNLGRRKGTREPKATPAILAQLADLPD